MAIPSCLVDTNVLLRTARRNDPQHRLVNAAVAKLASENTILHYTHQNIAEVWNAMTRPVSRNGFGLAIEKAEREIRLLEAGATLLTDSEATYREWRDLIVRYGVSGVQVHDARLVATIARAKTHSHTECR